MIIYRGYQQFSTNSTISDSVNDFVSVCLILVGGGARTLNKDKWGAHTEALITMLLYFVMWSIQKNA